MTDHDIERSADPRHAPLSPGTTTRPGVQTLATTPPVADVQSALSHVRPPTLVVAARTPLNRLEAAVRALGEDPESVGAVPICAASTRYDGDLWTTKSVHPADLTGIGMRILDGMERAGSESSLVVDGVDVLCAHASERRVCQLLQTVADQARDRRMDGLYCLAAETVSERARRRFSAVCDTEVFL